MAFLSNDFLLSNDTACQLYHDFAASQPIYDYHCHLAPADLANNRRFGNLFEAWLEGDHYKWRAMRANGVEETYCTGEADPYEKFLAFAKTVPHTIRNPLYHWTHLELQRTFGIDLLLNEDTAREIWDEANRQLAEMPVASLLDKFNVALVGTTDDPLDDLRHHQAIAAGSLFSKTVVVPTFRPDRACMIQDGEAFDAYVNRLQSVSGVDCATFEGFLEAIKQRHDFFHEHGARISDHGLTHIPAPFLTVRGMGCGQAKTIFETRGAPQKDREEKHAAFVRDMLIYLGELDAEKNWTQQYHLGATRNNNGWAMDQLGPDTGFDSIGDFPQGEGLSWLLGELARRQKLPQTILYNLNPADNYLFASMAGNFQGGPGGRAGVPGKIQYGSAWWFLDQKEGMTGQLNTLSSMGLLTRFVGMLTDSRSF